MAVAAERRAWFPPWVRPDEFADHLREDADVHSAAKKTSDEILVGVDAVNIAVTDLATRLKPLLPITDDLGKIVGQRRFRHDVYQTSAKILRGAKKMAGYGGTAVVGLAAIAAVNAPANDLLQWLLIKLTFGAISVRMPAIIQQSPIIPGVH